MTAVTCIRSCVSKSFLLHLRTSKSMKDSWRYEFLNISNTTAHNTAKIENSDAYILISTADKWLRSLAFDHVCPRAFFCIFDRRNRWRIREDMNFWISTASVPRQYTTKIRKHISQQVLLINDCGHLHSFMCVQELSFASSIVKIDGGFVKIWIFEYF